MESDDFTRHYIIRYLSARELVLPPLRSTRGLAPRPMIVVFGLRMRLCTCMASYGASLECHSFPAARRVWPRETTTELGQCCEQFLNWSSFEWSELRAMVSIDFVLKILEPWSRDIF